jgi:hypothetical protein
MMPQREAGDSLRDRTEATYGAYEGEPATAGQQYEPSYNQSQDRESAKVYPTPRSNKNTYILAIFITSLIVMIVFAILALIFFTGAGAWVSLIVIASIIFLLAVVVIDKLK